MLFMLEIAITQVQFAIPKQIMCHKFSRKHLNTHLPGKSFIQFRNLEIHILLSPLDIIAHIFVFKKLNDLTEVVFWND